MSVLFSAVDDADDPGRAISYLDVIADAATGMKHYAAAAHAQRRPQGLVLDLGCGSGHDLVLLARLGVSAVGVDPSAVLLASARERAGCVPLVRAVGEALPFADRTIAGCRIERVFIHVDDPVVATRSRALPSTGRAPHGARAGLESLSGPRRWR